MNNTATLIKELTFIEWLEKEHGYTGPNIEQIEKDILKRNRRLVDLLSEEEGCLSYQSAERRVMRMLQEDYIMSSNNEGFQRQKEKFWWE